MDFNKISNTTPSYYYLPQTLLTHSLTATLIMTAPYGVLSVTSLWRQSLFMCLQHGYWQGDQAVAHPLNSSHRGQRWPLLFGM